MNKQMILILFLCIGFNVLDAQLLTVDQASVIDTSIIEEMKLSGIPGAALAIINDNKVVYEISYGYADNQTKVKMSDTTIFQIASVTKIFTAITLLTELKNAHIDLNDPVGKVIRGLSPKLSSVTFHQLLTHTSGMIDYFDLSDNSEVFEFFKKTGDSILFIEPGQVFSYSSVGYALISLAIEQLSGRTYSLAVEKDVIIPLHLENTAFDSHGLAGKSFSAGHYYDNNKMVASYKNNYEIPIMQAGGGIYSNLQDLERLAFCLMNKGKLDGVQVIDSCIIEQMSFPHYKDFTPSAPSYYGFVSQPDNAYGYGLFMFDYGSSGFIGNGGAGTQMTYLLCEPKAKFAMIVLSNLLWDLLITSFKKIWEVVLGEEEPVKVDLTFNESEWKEIAGTYILPSLDKNHKSSAEVFEKDNKLYINYNGTGNSELEQIGQMVYRYSTPYSRFPVEISFYRDKSNNVAYLRNIWRTWIKVMQN